MTSLSIARIRLAVVVVALASGAAALAAGKREYKPSAAERRALRGLGWAFDIVVMTTERFDETKGVVGTIAYPADRQGQVVYEAA